MGLMMTYDKQTIMVYSLKTYSDFIKVYATNNQTYKLYKNQSKFSKTYKLLKFAKDNNKTIIIVEEFGIIKYVKKLNDDSNHKSKLTVKDCIEIDDDDKYYEIVFKELGGIYVIDRKTYLNDPLIKNSKYKVEWIYTHNRRTPDQKLILSYHKI